jgi:ribose transport system ATP-binding protein
MGAVKHILKMRGITKSFPGVKALDAVDITLSPGRLTTVLGENGAGKSTLMRIIAGALQPDAGTYLYKGGERVFRNPKEALDLGITMIYQELNLIQELSIAENIFLGREPLNCFGLIDYGNLHDLTTALLDRLQLDLAPWTLVNSLRVGHQQLVEIAKAISYNAEIIIMDEPTSAISEHEVEILFEIIRALKAQGVAILYITHKIDELEYVADDFVVMRDGMKVGEGSLKDYTHKELIGMMVGRQLGPQFRRTLPEPAQIPLLEVCALNLKHPIRENDFILEDINFSVFRGEILGIFGLMGAGRTELLESIYGLQIGNGCKELFLEGCVLEINSPRDAILQGIVLVPEDRKAEGLILGMTVLENVSLPALNHLSFSGWIEDTSELSYGNKALTKLNVKMSNLKESIQNLSGGNQQKAILAKWLAMGPKVILLDEPTRGIDVGAKNEIYELIDQLASLGLGVVLVSSELPEILSLSDRVIVLAEGRKTAELQRSELSEHAIMEAAVPKSRIRGNHDVPAFQGAYRRNSDLIKSIAVSA